MSNLIPTELTSRPQWLKWYETDDGGKRPIGKSNDPATWCEYDDISHHDRIAFVIDGNDPYTGIDLDGCITDGEFEHWATEILNRFEGLAYCEVSPSGKGVKLLTRGKKPDGSRCTHKIGEGKTQVECYDHARFWTITKKTLNGFNKIGDGQAAIDWLCDKYLKGEPRKTSPKRVEPSGSMPSLSLLKRAQAYCDKVPGGSAGDLRNSAFKLAGNLHAFVGDLNERLTDSDVFHLLRSWNVRCAQQLRDDELQEAAVNGRKNGKPPEDKPPTQQVVDYGVDISGILNQTIGHTYSSTAEEYPDDTTTESTPPDTSIRRMKLSEMRFTFPSLREPVIEGLLRRGETMNIIASPKVGKSFLGIGLAWSIVTGQSWLGFDVRQGRVLIVDNECHQETITDRLDRAGNKLMVSDPNDSIEVISLRGANVNIHDLHKHFSDIEPGEFSLVLVDALYRTLPDKTSENDNAAMMAVYNKLDRYAAMLDCAIVCIHHASKGDQSTKGITDIGAGAGSISRAADSHLVIRPHEDPSFCVLEAVTRSFKSPKAQTIKFDYPVWQAIATEAKLAKPTQPRDEKQSLKDDSAKKEVLEVLRNNTKPMSQSRLLEKLSFGSSASVAFRILMIMANKDKTIKRRTKTKLGSKKPCVFWQSCSTSCSA